MAFTRRSSPAERLQGEALTEAMVGIGLLFGGRGAPDPDLEETLLAASEEGMDRDDLRVLSLLITWLEVHHARLHADRLIRLVRAYASPRVRTFWAAVAHWLERDRRFARLLQTPRGPRLDLLSTGTDFHLARSGEDARFAGGPLRVPAGILRHRLEDVLSPVELSRKHGTYRRRILMGTGYRADMWAELDRHPTLMAAELARRTRGSFATAWQVKRDHALLRSADTG